MSGKYFTGDQKLSKKLIGRTKEALRQRNVQFAQTHGDASDEELLDYIRRCADELGRTPLGGRSRASPIFRNGLEAGPQRSIWPDCGPPEALHRRLLAER